MQNPQRERLRPVTGRHNALVKQVRRAFAHGELTPDGNCPIEGLRIVEEAIRSGLHFKAVLFSESALSRADRLLPQISAQAETLVLPEALFTSMVPSEHPQGVAALVRVRQFPLEDVLRARPQQPALVVALAGVQDPGNLGTVLRSVEAFGGCGVLLGENTASPYNSKVVRASAGSIFRLPVVRHDLESAMQAMRERGLRLLATSSHKGTLLYRAGLRADLALFIGNEGGGLPRDLLNQVDEVIAIPHTREVESLNAAVAASIVLYEASR